MAKDELLWYFSHHERVIAAQIPRSSLKSAQPQYFDPIVTELLALIIQLRQITLRHQTVIQEFYANLFKTHYGNIMESIITDIMKTNAPCDEVTKMFQSILENLQSAVMDSTFDVS
jgi:hypothetical protein